MYGLNAVEPTTELARPFDLALFDDNSPPQVLPIGSTPHGPLNFVDYASRSCGLRHSRVQDGVRASSTFWPMESMTSSRCCVSHEKSIRGKQKKGGEGALVDAEEKGARGALIDDVTDFHHGKCYGKACVLKRGQA